MSAVPESPLDPSAPAAGGVPIDPSTPAGGIRLAQRRLFGGRQLADVGKQPAYVSALPAEILDLDSLELALRLGLSDRGKRTERQAMDEPHQREDEPAHAGSGFAPSGVL